MRKKYLVLAVLSFVAIAFFAHPLLAHVAADPINDVQNGIAPVDPGGPTVDSAVSAAVRIIGYIIGIAAVIMIMVGGFKYITSSGDANQVAGAKRTILYALIGMAIAAVTQLIVKFVLHNATN